MLEFTFHINEDVGLLIKCFVVLFLKITTNHLFNVIIQLKTACIFLNNRFLVY